MVAKVTVPGANPTTRYDGSVPLNQTRVLSVGYLWGKDDDHVQYVGVKLSPSGSVPAWRNCAFAGHETGKGSLVELFSEFKKE